jgi:translation initiation factor 3 subunit J
MTDNWDDGSDDEWDVDDDALDAKLGLKKDESGRSFDDEEDLALKEKAAQDKANQAVLKKKGNALAAKKAADKEKADEEEMARKALELEEEMMSKLSVEERNAINRQRQEESEMNLFDDMLGSGSQGGGKVVQQPGDKLVMKDLKDHLKHAKKVASTMKVICSLKIEFRAVSMSPNFRHSFFLF